MIRLQKFLLGVNHHRHALARRHARAHIHGPVGAVLRRRVTIGTDLKKVPDTLRSRHIEVAAILGHQAAKRMPRRKFHHLGEHELADMHEHLPDKSGKPAVIGAWCSNRLHSQTSRKPCQFRLLLAGTRESVGHYWNYNYYRVSVDCENNPRE